MKDAWVKINTEILDDIRIATLPDKEWRNYIEGIAHNPKNIHCDPAPERLHWRLVGKRMRKEILRRDPNKCKYCGSTKDLEIDHIIPLARGGTSDLDNLQILCKTCNLKKWAKL